MNPDYSRSGHLFEDYICQPCEFSCGPTALYNAIIWANSHNPNPVRPSFRRLFYQCEAEAKLGTLSRKLHQVLQDISNDPRFHLRLTQPHSKRQYLEGKEVTVDLLLHELKRNRIILIEFHWKHGNLEDEHYALLTAIRNQQSRRTAEILVVNPDEMHDPGRVARWYKLSEIQKLLLFHEYPSNTKYLEAMDLINPKIWILESTN